MRFNKENKLELTGEEYRLLQELKKDPSDAYPAYNNYEEGFFSGLLVAETLNNGYKFEDIVINESGEEKIEE